MTKTTNKIRETLGDIVGFFIVIIVGFSLIGNLGIARNKKGMLGNLIGAFIVVMVGFSLMGPITQEINNAYYCNGTSMNISLPEGAPTGETDSFGGGGAAQFGGYDGVVKHSSFRDKIASTSFIKTNESILNPDCLAIVPGSAQDTIIKIVPGFFALALLVAGIGIMYSTLGRSGLIGNDYGV